MHIREHIELAALLATHMPRLCKLETLPIHECLPDYWACARARVERWSRSLTLLDAPRESTEYALPWEDECFAAEPLLHEIFAADILTRVWAASVYLLDHTSTRCSARAMSESIHMAHMQTRSQAKRWLAQGAVAETPLADSIDLLRRQCERWNDLLLSGIWLTCETVEQKAKICRFAFDPSRTTDFAKDFSDNRHNERFRTAWAVAMGALKGGMQACLTAESASPDLNARVSTAVMASLGDHAFEFLGDYHTAWMVRVHRTTAEAMHFFTQLQAIDHPGDAPAITSSRWMSL